MARLQIIDAIRGGAIVLMIAYHTLFTADYFRFATIDLSARPLSFAPYLIGSTFILVSGFVSQSADEKRQKRKALELGLIAIGISIATWLFDKELFIRFGVIHLLATCAFLSIFAKKIDTKYLIIIAIISLYLGVTFSTIAVSNEYLFPIGLISPNYMTFDHYPLFPWLGVFLLGFVLNREFGAIVEKTNEKYVKIFEKKMSVLEILGKKSIEIYILHQPIIIGLLFLISRLMK